MHQLDGANRGNTRKPTSMLSEESQQAVPVATKAGSYPLRTGDKGRGREVRAPSDLRGHHATAMPGSNGIAINCLHPARLCLHTQTINACASRLHPLMHSRLCAICAAGGDITLVEDARDLGKLRNIPESMAVDIARAPTIAEIMSDTEKDLRTLATDLGYSLTCSRQ